MLSACHSDIDLNNIDTQAEVEMGLALPVGSFHATIGDFFGKGIGNFYVDSLNNDGVITWKDTFKIARNFHQVDLAQYISEKQLTLNVYDKLPAALLIGSNKRITGTGDPITLDFDMPLKLKGINHPDSLEKERLDSALIEMASFTSIIMTNNLPLEWEWIDQVTLDLGEQLRRPAGNTMVIYDKNRDNYGYNQTIPTEVDNFTINMMKKNSAGQFVVGQVVDSCDFMIHFTFTVPTGTIVDIPEDAGFDYHLGVQFIDYAAIWGKFMRSKDMYDEAVVDLSESWGALDFISKWNVPFADPQIDMAIVTRVAGAMKVDGDYLFSEDAEGNKHYATFKYGASTHQDFHKQFENHEYLDPITSEIGDSTTNMMIPFDKDPERGHIDQLFQNMPQKLGYKFGIDFNYSMTPQIRITPNTAIRIDAVCTLPFIFNQGLSMDYIDTISDINLSQYSIDSLLKEVNFVDTMKATDVTLYLKAQNMIPLDVYASMRCLDAAGLEIKDPDDPTKPLLLFPTDTITLKAPNFVKEGGNWMPKTPGETLITVQLTKRQLDLLPLIKHIRYTAIINDKSLEDAYSKGLSNIRITDDQGMNLKIGITAHVDAILNLNGDKNQ
ncbi:MAG: hypothetical protein J6T71_06580 [Paludibacteraceae bacterium]|nr:hypothetical protein [Paludibacteraceae bacterium]